MRYSLLMTATSLVSLGIAAITVSPVRALTCPDGFDAGSISANQIERSNPCGDHQSGTPDSDRAEAEAADPSQGANLDADCKLEAGENLNSDNCGIVGYIVTITNILSAAVGIVIVIMIAVGGMQYSMARDDPQAVTAAKGRIQNAILALIIYLFGFALLQYIVPGGLF